jgi:DNA-binding transcriptional MerR regulator
MSADATEQVGAMRTAANRTAVNRTAVNRTAVMRMAELARRSGIAVSTIKYYLRAGLLPPGHVTARNQAEYTERHLHRLRLIDTLVGLGGLPVTAAGSILAAVDDLRVPAGALVGTVQSAARAGRARGFDDEGARSRAEARVTAVLGAGGRPAGAGAELLDRLIEACAVADQLGAGELGAALAQYAAAARFCAACDDSVLRACVEHRGLAPQDPAVREAVVVVMVLGAVLRSALTGVAQQDLLPPLLGPPEAG